MLQRLIKYLPTLLLMVSLFGCDLQATPNAAPKEQSSMQSINYICALEKDHTPPRPRS